MSIIDHLASIPYRIFGVVIILLCIIVGIPLLVIPLCLNIITSRFTINQIYAIGKDIAGKSSLKEIFETYDQTGDWWLHLVGVLLSKIVVGICMIICGIYYDEIYEEVMNLK